MADTAALHPPLPSMGYTPDEETGLREMLDHYRAVLLRKGSGLTATQLAVSVAASDLTIGGLIGHMALVEDIWFVQRLQGNEQSEPWASMDWEADADAEMTASQQLTPAELISQFQASLERSRAAYAQAESLDQLAAAVHPSGTRWNLRWIMIHMIEEYARHCGHADLIRQSIDGVVDD